MDNYDHQVPPPARGTGTLTKSQIRKQNKLAWQRSLTVLVVDPSLSTNSVSQSKGSAITAALSTHCSLSLPSPPNTPSTTTASVSPSQAHVAHSAKDLQLPPSPLFDHTPSDARLNPSSSPSKRPHPYIFPPGYHPPQHNSRRQRAKRRREEQEAWQNEWYRVWSLDNPSDCSFIDQNSHQPTFAPPQQPLHQRPHLHFSLVSSTHGYSTLCQQPHLSSPPPWHEHHRLWSQDMVALSSPFLSHQTPSPNP